MPFLTARPGTIPEDDHGDDCQCSRCNMERGLTADDLEIVRYYACVADLCTNAHPMADKPIWSPRLADWLTAFPDDLKIELVEGARFLLRACAGDLPADCRGLSIVPATEFEPLQFEED